MIQPHGNRLVDRFLSEDRSDRVREEFDAYPSVCLDDEGLFDILNLATGRYSPLTGFVTRTDFDKVIEDMTLETGVVWTLPITLDVGADTAERVGPGERLGLEAPGGNPAGYVDVEEVYRYNKEETATALFGTGDESYPGVAQLSEGVPFLVGGDVVRAAGRDDDIYFGSHREWLSTTVPAEPPVDGFPRMLSNTDPFSDQQYLGAETDVVYILRHPADVMESFYDYRCGRWNDDVGTFAEFICGERWCMPAWRRHVESWEDYWDVLVQFEDLKEDSVAKLRRIVDLFDREFDESTLEYAAERSSFETMRRLEQEHGKPERYGANPDYTLMREGSADRGVSQFDETDYEYLDEAAGDVIDRYGYEVSG